MFNCWMADKRIPERFYHIKAKRIRISCKNLKLFCKIKYYNAYICQFSLYEKAAPSKGGLSTGLRQAG